MRLCFDATRFGCGLDEALDLAAQKGVAAIEYSFGPFATASKSAALDDKERKYLASIKEASKEKNVDLACLNLDYCLVPQDKRSQKKFREMLAKLAHLAECIGCQCIAVSVLPSFQTGWLEVVAEEICKAQKLLSQHNVHLLLRLAAPTAMRGQSLKKWQTMEPQDWRDIIAQCPGLSLSFSPADCLWLGIDYLHILSGLAPAIEHIEAHDIEINRLMLKDSGMFGPLWWRYRICGKGQVDWRQLIEALKLYDFKGTFSLQLDDEFVDDHFENLENALDTGIKFVSPLLKD
jgi:sugar phosphate isomerase/epimerase